MLKAVLVPFQIHIIKNTPASVANTSFKVQGSEVYALHSYLPASHHIHPSRPHSHIGSRHQCNWLVSVCVV